MKAVPAEMPATRPDKEPTVPMAVLLLLHLPPLEMSLNVVVAPVHTWAVPVIADGVAYTVTITEVVAVPQPVVTE